MATIATEETKRVRMADRLQVNMVLILSLVMHMPAVNPQEQVCE